MIQVALMLLLAVGGCSHYQEKGEEDQIGSTFFYNPEKEIVPVYPLPLLVSSPELDDYLQKGNWQGGSCRFQLLAAQWLYFHQQPIIADKIIDYIIADNSCELAQEAALWWRAWSNQQQTHWNSSMLTLSEMAQTPSSPLYAQSFSSMMYASDKRKTSIVNLSLSEEERLARWQQYAHWLSQLPSPEIFAQAENFPTTTSWVNTKHQNVQVFERLMIIYDSEPPESFVTQIFHDFQEQNALKELYILSKKHDQDLILELLHQDIKTFLVGYNLEQPLPKEWLHFTQASLSVGEHFTAQRSQDYHFPPKESQFLSQIEQGQYLLRPQLVIYDQEHASLLEHPLIQAIPHKLEISTQDYQESLVRLLALPQRQAFFQPYLKNAHYINQPRNLPYNILLLLEPSLLRLSYPFLRYWHQERPLFIALTDALTGIETLDSTLKGLLLPAPPRYRQPKQTMPCDEAQDLLALVNRWPWFQFYQGYLYEGKIGRYRLNKQQLECEWDIVLYQGE